MEQELMDILTDLRPDVDFETETALIDDHILESFDIVSLVAALNDAFDIEIGAKDLVPENFNSAKRLLAMVQRLQDEDCGTRLHSGTAAEKYGTPLYLFDLEAFTARAQRVRAAFGSDVNLCYSMKANPFVLRGLPDVFRWVEVCSPGELTICEKLGIPPERILYSGVNKGADDVARAVALGADLLTAESTLHFELICAAAAAQGKHVRVLPRLTAGSQFGMDPDALADLIAGARSSRT